MTIDPLTAAAVPAGVAALKLAGQVRENQPFRELLRRVVEPKKQSFDTPESTPLDDLQKLVQQRLSSAGIETSLKFEITSDAAGNLQVAGNHPRLEEIQRALLRDPKIEAAFAKVKASYTAEPGTAAQLSPPRDASKPDAQLKIIINGDEIEVDHLPGG